MTSGLKPSPTHLRLLTYLAGFFLTINIAFPSYFNAEFLHQFTGPDRVGLIFSLASLVTIATIANLPRLFRRFGLLPIIGTLAAISAAASSALIFSRSPLLLGAAFILHYSLGFSIRCALDLYLEKISDNRLTGNIRGIFLTFINLAWLVSPFIAGNLLAASGFSTLYLISAAALAPVIWLTTFNLTEAPAHRVVQHHRFFATLRSLWRHESRRRRDIFHILLADFLLQFFYALMVIYMAIFLVEERGFSLIAVGSIFTIMLLPFVLFEYPLGRLADHFWGEKEMLIAGFSLMGVATLSLPFLPSGSLWLWALALFLTRAGAASVEIMKETYLFKKISADDDDILSVSRLMSPAAYLVAPLCGTVIISLFGISTLYLALGLIMFLGIIPASLLKDTR